MDRARICVEAKEEVEEMTKINYCGCVNKYQDEQYGKGKRVFNSMMKENYYRCTVCGKERLISKK